MSSSRRTPRHDRDAGGDPRLLAAKSALRERVWRALDAAGASRWPGARGRIPNFVGAEAAAERLGATAAWSRAEAVKANPDSPQRPVRERALEDGKLVYMAVPRLAADHPFLLLDPAEVTGSARSASSIKGAGRFARPVDLGELQPVDLVVTGCVAVGEDGSRLGKGGGFSDLEFAVAATTGLVGPETVVATTVHDVQVLPPGEIPMAAHDVRLDLMATPERVIEPRRHGRRRDLRGAGLRWDELTPDKIAAIPLLQRLQAEGAP